MFTRWSKIPTFLASSSWTILEVEENFIQSLSAFFLLFWWQKIAFKSPFDLYFHPLIIEFFWFAQLVQNREKYTHLGCYVVDASRSAEGRVFLFSSERLGRCLLETIVASFLKFWISGQNAEFHIHQSHMEIGYLRWLKVASTTFLVVYFLCLKDSTSETRKMFFLFHFKSSFHSWDNQILTFQIFECHDVIKCLSMTQETYFTG